MSKRNIEHSAGSASELAAELHALGGRLKRRLREEASAGDLTPSQTAVLRHLLHHGHGRSKCGLCVDDCGAHRK